MSHKHLGDYHAEYDDLQDYISETASIVDILTGIAGHDNTPLEIREKLAQDENDLVAYCAANHDHTPKTLIYEVIEVMY